MYLLRKTIFSSFVKNFIRKFCALDQDLTKPFEVHSVSGCCFMMSEKCAHDITPFDEETFLYQEELIIGIKMEEKGYKTVYYPSSEVTHVHGQSTKHIKAFSYICLVESEIYYFRKYLKTSKTALFPLYIIRTAKYITLCLIHQNFRTNIKLYFQSTLKKCFGIIQFKRLLLGEEISAIFYSGNISSFRFEDKKIENSICYTFLFYVVAFWME